MRDFKYNEGSEITIKTQWDEVTIYEFNQITEVLKADVSEKIKFISIISILTNRPEGEISNLPVTVFTKLLNSIEFITQAPPKIQYKNSYMLNGHEYIVKADVTKITASQYIDYQNYMKEDPIDSVKILSLWLIPKGHEYNDGYDLDKVFKDLSNLNVMDANAIAFFLRKQFQVFMILMVDSLENQLKKMGKSKKEIKEMITPFNNMVSSLS